MAFLDTHPKYMFLKGGLPLATQALLLQLLQAATILCRLLIKILN